MEPRTIIKLARQIADMLIELSELIGMSPTQLISEAEAKRANEKAKLAEELKFGK